MNQSGKQCTDINCVDASAKLAKEKDERSFKFKGTAAVVICVFYSPHVADDGNVNLVFS